jgi:hypothetical protein
MGNGNQIDSGTFKGRLILPLVHSNFNGGVVLHSDDHGYHYNLSHGLAIPGIDETQIAVLGNGSLMSLSRNCFTPSTLPPASGGTELLTCNGFAAAEKHRRYHQQQQRSNSIATSTVHASAHTNSTLVDGYTPGQQLAVSYSHDGGVTWGPIRLHPDLPTPGCKASIIGYKGAVYWAGPYSTTRRENLTVLASDDDGLTFSRSLQIVPVGPAGSDDPNGYPTPGAGYSQLQCGLPMPLDCAIVWDNRQEFNYQPPYCNLSFVRFASADVK